MLMAVCISMIVSASACFSVDVCFVNMSCMSLVIMSRMSGMVMSELTGCKGRDEYRKAEEYDHTSPSEVPFAMRAFASMIFMFMVMPVIASVSVHFKSFTVSLYAAVFVMMPVARFCVSSFVYTVCCYAHNYSDDEQHCEQDHCLLRYHCKHDKRLIA